MEMGTWVVVGLLTGLVASKLLLRTGEGLGRDVGLGIGGAMLGGSIFAAFGGQETAGFDVFGVVVTLASASAVLVVYHMLFPFVRRG